MGRLGLLLRHRLGVGLLGQLVRTLLSALLGPLLGLLPLVRRRALVRVAAGRPGGLVAGPDHRQHLQQWGSVSTVSRYSGGYNAWTGNAWRGQVGAAYNSRTGTIAAGQRGAVGNIYSGQYAHGGRGAAYNPNSGTAAAGGRVTVGDADSGRQGTAGRVGAANPGTGESGSAGWVRGEEGGAARVGDDFYAGKDGGVYKRSDRGDWSQVDRRAVAGRPESIANQGPRPSVSGKELRSTALPGLPALDTADVEGRIPRGWPQALRVGRTEADLAGWLSYPTT